MVQTTDEAQQGGQAGPQLPAAPDHNEATGALDPGNEAALNDDDMNVELPQQPQTQARRSVQHIQHRPQTDRDRAGKSRTPELVSFFKSLSLQAQLEWNKGREERNLRRENARIEGLTDPLFAPSDSENESIFSLADEDLDALCDPDIYNSYSNSLPKKLMLQLATRKRKQGSLDNPKEGDPSSPDSKRRRMDGKSLRNVGNQLTLLEFPDVMFDTENAKVFIPLPLFHPECIQHVAANLNRVALTRVNPSPGELKGQLVLDVDKLSALFGEESSPTFSFDRFLAASINYTRFQSMRDIDVDPVTRQGNGSWSRVWFDHFNFFTSQPDAGALYPHWHQSELKLRSGILNKLSTYSFAKYEHLFELARSRAETASLLLNQHSSAGPSVQKQFFRADNKTARFEKKLPPRGRKVVCTSCAGSHSAADHIGTKLPDTFPDGKPTFCHTSAGKLLHPDGREVCIIYNLSTFTAKKCNHGSERVHLCSFCGGAHPAFSWSCRRSPA